MSAEAVTVSDPWRNRERDISSGTVSARPPYLPLAEHHPPEEELYWWAPYGGPPAAQAALLEAEIEGRSLAMPLLVRIGHCGGYYEIEHEEFGLFGCGRTQAEAVEDFIAFLIVDFKHYALARDEDLDPEARKLAGRYRRLFGIEG